MKPVLVVEDFVDTQRLIARALAPELVPRMAGSVREALDLLERETPELALLDLSLPDGDGFEICAALQREERTRDVPVIFLTARGETRDKVMAFSLGADDYVEKPFDPTELRVRIASRLQKRRAAAARAEMMWKGPLRIDLGSYRAYERGTDGSEEDLGLTPHELRLLHHLASHEGRVRTRKDLLEAAWGGVVVSERTVDTHLSNLRKKLGGSGRCIESVRGVGYRFVGPS
jgi:two-component system phosphate regulon response regulator PhoB